MRLFLLRHAHAKDTYPDSERQISTKGYAQLDKICKILDANIFIDTIEVWHSPYQRAIETAQYFTKKMNIEAKLNLVNRITPHDCPMSFAKTLAKLTSFGGDLLVVSHNPFLESLTDILLDGNFNTAHLTVKKASLIGFTLNQDPSYLNEYGSWNLDFVISPNILNV